MKGLFWGLLTIDLHFFTDHYPVENSKVKARKFDSYTGGPATNAAITFAHLGGDAQLITSIGKNPFNSMVYEDISNHAVDVKDMRQGKMTDPVFASIITSNASGERTIFSYHPPKLPVDKNIKVSSEFDIALFDGFYMETAIDQARVCRDHGIITVFDGGSWKNGTDELLKYIDVAICSEDFTPPGVVQQEDITAYLLNTGVKKTAITRGGKAIIVNEGEVNLLVEVPPTEVVDTLGAGDIFHGAFCFFYAKDKNFYNALEKAARIASGSCRFPGPRKWMD